MGSFTHVISCPVNSFMLPVGSAIHGLGILSFSSTQGYQVLTIFPFIFFPAWLAFYKTEVLFL